MARRRHLYAQPIGFLRRAPAPVSPFQVTPPFPQAQMIPPFPPNQPFFPNPGGTMPQGIPPVTQPTNPGIGGLLQNLFSGKGSLDIQSVMSNAQKMIGVVNQLGSAVRSMSPMLEMLKGLSDPEPLTDTDDEPLIPERRKRRRYKKTKRRRNSRSRKASRKSRRIKH